MEAVSWQYVTLFKIKSSVLRVQDRHENSFYKVLIYHSYTFKCSYSDAKVLIMQNEKLKHVSAKNNASYSTSNFSNT